MLRNLPSCFLVPSPLTFLCSSVNWEMSLWWWSSLRVSPGGCSPLGADVLLGVSGFVVYVPDSGGSGAVLEAALGPAGCHG